MKSFLVFDRHLHKAYLLTAAEAFGFFADRGLLTISDMPFTAAIIEDLYFNTEYQVYPEGFNREIQPSFIEIHLGSHSFGNITEAVEFFKENNYTSASDGVVYSTVKRAVVGATKSAYGLSCNVIKNPLPLETFEFMI